MKGRILCSAMFFFFLLTGISQAKVESAKIFPQGCNIRESKVMESGRNIFFLPGKADPETLSVSPAQNSFEIKKISRKKIKRQYPEKIQKLQQKLDKLKLEHKRMQARLKSKNNKIDFWEAQIDRKWDNAQDALEIGKAFTEPLSNTYLEKIDIKQEIRETEQKIETVKEQIREVTAREHEKWQITLHVSGPSPQESKVDYSYYYPYAGYNSTYNLKAMPGENKISFTWNTEIWQKTGKSWNNTDITLATVKPSFELTPPGLSPWIIKTRTPKKSRADRAKIKAQMASRPEKGHARAAVESPRRQRKSTYTQWHLGSLDLPSKSPQTTELRTENWPAEFRHLLRPKHFSKSFLMAKIDLEEAKQIPRGEAQFFLQGTLIGKDDFQMQGNKNSIFFGNDPLVKSEKNLIQKKKGEKGFIQGKQTYKWEWNTRITNSHPYSVKVKVEEAIPQARHEDIELQTSLDPEPKETNTKQHKYVWELRLQKDSQKEIRMQVAVEAPENMDLIGL